MSIYNTNQEVFNKVWERAKIPVKSGGKDCFYRNPDGSANHCFVGVCIPDELYKDSMEGKSIPGIRNSDQEIYDKIFGEEVDQFFLQELQAIHDDYEIEDWEDELRSIATGYELTIPA